MMSNRAFGIDVSKWQKGFSFEKAKAEGVEFVIIKGSQAEFTDPEFVSHYNKAKAAGLSTGVYHYLTATDEAMAVRHAQYLIDKCLKNRRFDFPVFADAEDTVLKSLGKGAVDKIITAFCTTLEKAGYWAGFYCNYDFYKNHCSGETLAKRFSLWLASWTKEPYVPCQLWQFGGETNVIRSNTVAGVVCDQNYAFYDYPTLIKGKGLNGYPKQSAKETVSAVSTSFMMGDRVRLSKDAVIYGSSDRFASWVYNSTLYLRELNKNRAVISTQKSGVVTGAVDVKYLIAE